MEYAASGLSCLLMHSTHTHRIVVHTGARQLHPIFTRNTPHPLPFSTLGVALLGLTGRPTACEGGQCGRSDLSTEGGLNAGAAVVVVGG